MHNPISEENIPDIVTGQNKIAEELCEAFGIKNARSLTFRIVFDEIATVQVEFIPEIKHLEKFIYVMKKYNIHIGEEIQS